MEGQQCQSPELVMSLRVRLVERRTILQGFEVLDKLKEYPDLNFQVKVGN
jgi:hypothetical protein